MRRAGIALKRAPRRRQAFRPLALGRRFVLAADDEGRDGAGAGRRNRRGRGERAARLEVDERRARIGLDALEPRAPHQIGRAAGGEPFRVEGARRAAERDFPHGRDRVVADAEGRARPT